MADAQRAYVDRPISDRGAAEAAAHAAAEYWGLADPQLLRVGMNAIFTADDVVLRVSTPSVSAMASLDVAAFLAGEGIRVPRPLRDDVVAVDGCSVTCWERIRSSGAAIDWRRVGAMVRTLQSLDPSSLPEFVPLPSPTALPWWDFDSMLALVGGALDDDARVGVERVIERHRGWDAFRERVVCHGDVHPGNVMMDADGAVLLDWDLLCLAPPGWDHAMMLTWASRWGGDVDAYPAFAAGFGRTMVDDEDAIAFAELRLVAATLLRVRASMADPSARMEAELRLRFWRGDTDAPEWTAQ